MVGIPWSKVIALFFGLEHLLATSQAFSRSCRISCRCNLVLLVAQDAVSRALLCHHMSKMINLGNFFDFLKSFVLFFAVLGETIASAKMSYSRILLHVRDCLNPCLQNNLVCAAVVVEGSQLQLVQLCSSYRSHSSSARSREQQPWLFFTHFCWNSVVLQWRGRSMLCQSFPNRAQHIVFANLLFLWKLSQSVFLTLEDSQL